MEKEKWALISVYDKTGIVEFVSALVKMGWKILSSGGTAKKLREAGLVVTDVAELSGLKPILDHRVVTLVWQVYAGLLAANSQAHLAELEQLRVRWIDLVCVDMYALLQAIAEFGDTEPEKVLEKTDIGGPTMLRAAAKGRRIVISRVEQRETVLRWLQAGCPDEERVRRDLAATAEAVVGDYCLSSARHISAGGYNGAVLERVPGMVAYAENRWQNPAGFHRPINGGCDSLAQDRFTQVFGDPVGFIGITDRDRALDTITHIAAGWAINFGDVPLIAIAVKHGNACGSAVGDVKSNVLRGTVEGDPDAIFGGLILTNFPIDEESANILRFHKWEGGSKGRPLDGIVAPAVDQAALEVFKRKDNRCRVFVNEALGQMGAGSLNLHQSWRQVRGGFLIQGPRNFVLQLQADYLEKYFGQSPSVGQEMDLLLAWAIGSTSTSNTITLVKDDKLLANAVGQQSRVAASRLAVEKAIAAGHKLKGAVAYSDSFFPFPDAVEVLANAGIGAVLASSDGQRYEQVKRFCDERRMNLYAGPDARIRGFFGH